MDSDKKLSEIKKYWTKWKNDEISSGYFSASLHNILIDVKTIEDEDIVKYGDFIQLDDRFESCHIWTELVEKEINGKWIPKKITKEEYENNKNI